MKNSLLQYILFGFVIGIVCGCACLIFCLATSAADHIGHSLNYLIFLLPAAGFFIVFLYDKLCSRHTLDTNSIYRYLKHGDAISVWQAPLIFISTCLAYLFGGSVGRAGSALQIGSGLAYMTGSAMKGSAIIGTPRPDLLMACGMSAAFTAIFNTPFAGAVFGVEMLILSKSNLSLILPSAISSFVTFGIARLVHIPYTDIHTDFGSASGAAPLRLDFPTLWRVLLIAVCASFLGHMFCLSRRYTTMWFRRLLKNPFARVAAGSLMVIAITLLIGHTECNGLGYGIAGEAIDGSTRPLNFLFKFILTLITLGCGIRGGEISPNIFIGATFGCAAAPYIGLNPCLAASVGMLATLSTVTNATIAVFIMGLELISFTPAAAAYFALTCIITHIFSGTLCLYTEQDTHKAFMKINW